MNHPNNMILMQIPWVLVILLKCYEWKISHEILQDFDAIVWMISGKKRLGKEATKSIKEAWISHVEFKFQFKLKLELKLPSHIMLELKFNLQFNLKLEVKRVRPPGLPFLYPRLSFSLTLNWSLNVFDYMTLQGYLLPFPRLSFSLTLNWSLNVLLQKASLEVSGV